MSRDTRDNNRKENHADKNKFRPLSRRGSLVFHLKHTHHIEVPPAKVWAAMADFPQVARWHPNVKMVDMLSENNQGVGASRRCNFHDGTSVVERITESIEGESFTVELSDFGKQPLAKAHATMSLKAEGSGSRVSIEMHYQVKYGPLGWLLGATMMRLVMKAIFKKVLRGLEYHVITDALVNSEVPKLPAAHQGARA